MPTRLPATITHKQLIDGLRALGIDPTVTTEVHITMAKSPGVRGAGIDLTVVSYALDDRGLRRIDEANNECFRVATTVRIEE